MSRNKLGLFSCAFVSQQIWPDSDDFAHEAFMLSWVNTFHSSYRHKLKA